MIPGRPQNVKIVGRSSDRIKLSWEPPAHNPEAAELYVVSMRVVGRVWEEVNRTKHTKALVTGLKSNRKYEFRVQAANATIISLATEKKSETELSKALYAALGLLTGVVGAPVVAVGSVGVTACLAAKTIKGDSELSTAAMVGITAATIPLSLLLSPITVPITAIASPIVMTFESTKGDVTPVFEDED